MASLLSSFLHFLLISALLFQAANVANAAVSVLTVYIHDKLNLEDPKNGTVVVSVPSPVYSGFLPFGTILVFDDKMTVGPSYNSPSLGRCQGAYISDSLPNPSNPYDISYLVTFTANFNNLGTINFHGQDPAVKPVREIAVIGGTEAFRFVTGYATFTTHEIIPPTSSVVKLSIYLKFDGPFLETLSDEHLKIFNQILQDE